MTLARPTLDPEASLGYQVRRCHRRFDRLLNARLAPAGLKSGYWYYLRVLWLRDGLTQRELSDLTNVAENTTVAMINGMAASGLVERTRDGADRRKMRVHLTAAGRALEGDLMRHALEINAVARAGIDEADLATCLAVLSRMSVNLQQALAEPGRRPAD